MSIFTLFKVLKSQVKNRLKINLDTKQITTKKY